MKPKRPKRKLRRSQLFRDLSWSSKIWNKLYDNSYDYRALSRKEKIKLFGRRWNKSKIRRELQKLVIYQPSGTLKSGSIFCPKCGCPHTKSTGNMAPYPELWEYWTCIRCDFQMASADNGPTVHYYEEDDSWKDWGITYIQESDRQDDTEFKEVFS